MCLMGFFAILSSTMSKNPVLKPFATSLGTPDDLLGINSFRLNHTRHPLHQFTRRLTV